MGSRRTRVRRQVMRQRHNPQEYDHDNQSAGEFGGAWVLFQSNQCNKGSNAKPHRGQMCTSQRLQQIDEVHKHIRGFLGSDTKPILPQQTPTCRTCETAGEYGLPLLTFNTLTVVMIAAAEAKPFNTGREIKDTINPSRSSPKIMQNKPTSIVTAKT
jgi:hypothetical protein